MIVASLIDAGVDPHRLRDSLGSLDLSGYELAITPVTKQGFAATRFSVHLDNSQLAPHRHLPDVLAMIDGSSLSAPTKARAGSIFRRLAQAEATVHGTAVDRVHFHEVGAVDAILDIVGAVICFELLEIERVACSPIAVGSGTVTCAHGVLPVPAPATVELLQGVPLARTEEIGELTTPTAAAVLTTVAEDFGAAPSMTIQSVGYGAGSREGRSTPNVLRVLIGEADHRGDVDEIVVLETNLDDASPELIGHCMARLLDEGALDVYLVPIHMKKSRSGVLLTVLCEHSRQRAMERILFAETTTFGIRRHRAQRVKMRRRFEVVSTDFGEIRMKVGVREGAETASPEFEDCKEAAARNGVSLRVVMAAADSAWRTAPES